MIFQSVESSMIQSVGYDEAAEILQVVFNTGKVYEYSGVPKEVYAELLSAASKGSFMQQSIIDCYPYRKVRRRSGV